MNDFQQVADIAKSVSDYGAMAVMSAIYLLLSAAMMVAIFKWFKSIINQILEDNRSRLEATMNEERKQTEMLVDISEGLRIETQLRIQNISDFAFDLSIEQVCRIIKNIREQNHISDHKATAKKIRGLLNNIHNERNNRFDAFTYRGKRLSSYCPPEWIEKVAQVIEGELYNPQGADNKRAFTNVKMIYDDIRIEFQRSMNG